MSSQSLKYPIHLLWDGVLFIPLYGIIDSESGQEIMESILEELQVTRSRMIIMDILGVSTVDSAVANHLIKITKASNLMGAECIISGISPSVAQTIVSLGIELGDVETRSTLKDALERALEVIDVKESSKR